MNRHTATETRAADTYRCIEASKRGDSLRGLPASGLSNAFYQAYMCRDIAAFDRIAIELRARLVQKLK